VLRRCAPGSASSGLLRSARVAHMWPERPHGGHALAAPDRALCGVPLDPPWDAVLGLAWEAFVRRSTPIGAVVVDPLGRIVAGARGRRFDSEQTPGQLSGTRIAHAELNALALLPTNASYGNHTLYSSVEPCCLCLGAALQTGIGRVVFSFEDEYAGAGRCMTVTNPQAGRRFPAVDSSVGGPTHRLSALLLMVHYRVHRPALPHVTEPWERTEPELAQVARGPIGELISAAGRDGLPFEELGDRLYSAAPHLLANG
jgi:tRNA(Arg) A34 adenosine deaminase TadA